MSAYAQAVLTAVVLALGGGLLVHALDRGRYSRPDPWPRTGILWRWWIAVTEPLVSLRDRVRCRLLALHGPGCRGRVDHHPLRRGRWL